MTTLDRPTIITLQRALLALGFPLPRFGADGHLGGETLGALAALLADHGRTPAEVPGEVTEADLELVAQLVAARARPPEEVRDVRRSAGLAHDLGPRPWTAVTGICLHQTACILGERPERWASIGAHVGVTRAGRIMWMHGFERTVAHGNGFNAHTVGIEMDGTYAGVEGDPRTFWRPASEPGRQPQTPTAELVASARTAIRWIVAEVARHGGRVTGLYAHRQSSAQRQSDPGSALWQAVALPEMEELGLSDGGPGYRIGTGAEIPEAWNPARVGVAY